MLLTKIDGENPPRTMPTSTIPTAVRGGACLVYPLSVRDIVRSFLYKSQLSLQLSLTGALRLARPFTAKTTPIFRCSLVYAAFQLWLTGQVMLQDAVVMLFNAAFAVMPCRMRSRSSQLPYAKKDISRSMPRPEASLLATTCRAGQSPQSANIQRKAEQVSLSTYDTRVASFSLLPTQNYVVLFCSPAGSARRAPTNHVANLPRGAKGMWVTYFFACKARRQQSPS